MLFVITDLFGTGQLLLPPPPPTHHLHSQRIPVKNIKKPQDTGEKKNWCLVFSMFKRTVLRNLFVKIVLFLYIYVFDEITFSFSLNWQKVLNISTAWLFWTKDVIVMQAPFICSNKH